MSWLHDGMLWLSRSGVLLSCTCIHCGVWCGTDDKGRLVEFDHRPHGTCSKRVARTTSEPEAVTTCDAFT